MGKFVLGPKELIGTREPKASTAVEIKYIPVETIIEKEVIKYIEVPVETIVEKIVEVERRIEVPVETVVERIKTEEKIVIKEVEKLVEGPIQYIHKIVPREYMPKWAMLLLAIEAVIIISLVVSKIK